MLLVEEPSLSKLGKRSGTGPETSPYTGRHAPYSMPSAIVREFRALFLKDKPCFDWALQQVKTTADRSAHVLPLT